MHKKGQDGVDLARLVLESTTWIELPFTAEENETVCTLERLDGADKAYDAMGFILRDKKAPLYVESKNYSSAGAQGTAYVEFLANAYSVTARDILRKKVDGNREFMWFTTHPFSLTKWSDLVSPGEIKNALSAHPDALNGEPIDEDVLHLVSERLWLINVHHKQADLTLTAEELSKVEGLLNRKRR